MEDIIVDIIKDGRALPPGEIPSEVAAEVNAAIARGEEPGTILHEGVRYYWFVRPCVFP